MPLAAGVPPLHVIITIAARQICAQLCTWSPAYALIYLCAVIFHFAVQPSVFALAAPLRASASFSERYHDRRTYRNSQHVHALVHLSSTYDVRMWELEYDAASIPLLPVTSQQLPHHDYFCTRLMALFAMG